jgi:hypothetical protein
MIDKVFKILAYAYAMIALVALFLWLRWPVAGVKTFVVQSMNPPSRREPSSGEVRGFGHQVGDVVTFYLCPRRNRRPRTARRSEDGNLSRGAMPTMPKICAP